MTMNPIEKERFVSKLDAVSRVVIRAINWTDNPRISQMGKVVHNEALGGFVASDGYTVVTDKAQCFRQLVNQGQTMFPLPAEYPLHPYSGYPLQSHIAPLEAMPPFLIDLIYGKKNGTTSDAPASPKQVKYLLDLARQYGVNPEQIKAKFNVPALESLTKMQCSRAIDELSGKAA